ncbi:21042_t:CDS:2, partial [Racocetra persica]
KSLTNKSNAKAVCKCCIDQVGELAIAQVIQVCFITNKAKLCRAHLANCEAFKTKYMNEEVTEILSQSVPEDFHKNDESLSEDEEETISKSSSSTKRQKNSISIKTKLSTKYQQSITSYYNGRPISHKDKAQFEHLLLRMIISNGLSFAYIENEDTRAVFEFVCPGITLPSRKTIGEQVLLNITTILHNNIIKLAQKDSDGVIATFDSWTNVKQENIWGVVLVTSEG